MRHMGSNIMPNKNSSKRRNKNKNPRQPPKNKSKPKQQVIYVKPQKEQVQTVQKLQSPGAVLGDSLWTAGKSLFKNILGWGDYSLARNSIMGTSVPTMHGSRDSVRIRHREYITDLTMTPAFTTTTYSINPGLSATFPWLSILAGAFQEYDIAGMVFDYVPTSGEFSNATTPALGSVSMACQYRADLPPFASRLAMLNSEFSVDGRPMDNVLFPIECAPKEKPVPMQYIRSSQLGPNQDLKFYDLGTVTVATSGGVATSYIAGELWVTYDVILYKPTGTTINSNSTLQLNFIALSPTVANPFNTLTCYFYQGGPFSRYDGSGPQSASYFQIDGGVVTSQTNFGTLILPPGLIGMFKISCYVDCTSSTITTPGTISISANCSAVVDDSAGYGAYNIGGVYTNSMSLPAAGSVTQTGQMQISYFTVTAAQSAAGPVTLKYGKTGGMTLGTAPVLSVEITELNSNFTTL